ncbi:helix-turn-helix domain-containing protein [Streptomyces erythrochromogenes]|uniref:TetR/AcrR family transcriptional regulator n=1 Tax=Streptomyces erythrochromogenes TaxID=285574 RepID=UPI00343A0894
MNGTHGEEAEERRAEIVAAARRLFESRGYDDVTMNEVVADLAVAKGTVYHYFRSKEELLEAVVTDIVKQATERMRQVVEAADGGPVERLAALVSAGRVAGENEQVLHHLHRSQNAGMHTRLLAVAIELQAPLYAEVLREGTEAGAFQVDHPLEAAEFLLSGIQFLTDEGVAPWSPETLTRRARALPALAEQLLGAPEGSLAFLIAPARASD